MRSIQVDAPAVALRKAPVVVEANAVAVEDIVGDELVPVEVDGQDLRSDEIDPGRGTGTRCAESHRGGRREGVGAPDEVEVDVVSVDGDQLAALGSLGAGHIGGHGVILAERSWPAGGTVAPWLPPHLSTSGLTRSAHGPG